MFDKPTAMSFIHPRQKQPSLQLEAAFVTSKTQAALEK